MGPKSAVGLLPLHCQLPAKLLEKKKKKKKKNDIKLMETH
jgi:hypothetical protein